MIEQRVTLRYGAQQIPAIVQAVQGDTGRDVIFELADYEIPAGATANYYIDKPDDTAVYNSAEVISSTEILAHLTEQALAAPGRNNGQVRILSDGEVITSFDFVLEVEAFRGILRLQSETEVNIFDEALQAAAEEAIQEILDQTPVVTGMQNSIAPTYSASSTYAVGDYVMYNAQLYKCNTAITTAEAFTEAHWTSIPLSNEVKNLTNALSEFDGFTEYSNLFSQAHANKYYDISSSTGELVKTSNPIFTSDLIKFDGTKRIQGYNINRYIYCYDTNKNYIGYALLASDLNGIPSNTCSGTEYVRVQGLIANLSSAYVMYYDYRSTEYVPYNPVDGNIAKSRWLAQQLSKQRRLVFGRLYNGAYIDIDTTASPVTYTLKGGSYVLGTDGYAKNTGLSVNTPLLLTGFNINYFTLVYSISNNDFRCLLDYTGDYSDYIIFGYYDHGRIYGNIGMILVNGGVANQEIEKALSQYDVGDLDVIREKVEENTTSIGVNAAGISSEAVTRAAADDALGARIDNLVAPSGTSVAEITDARVGYDGTIYASIEARLNAEAGRVRNILVVGAGGQYQTIAAAVSAALNGDIVFVKRGVYEEHVLNRDKIVHIIGESKEETIWKYPNTDYGSCDCYDCGMGSIRNLTMWNYDNGETPSGQYGRSYCIHLDHQSYYDSHPPIGNYFYCENVHFINESNECLGLGLRNNMIMEFVNCDFETLSGNEAAFYVHSASATGAKCILNACKIRNNCNTGAGTPLMGALRVEGYNHTDRGCTLLLERSIAVNLGTGPAVVWQLSKVNQSTWSDIPDWQLDPCSALNNVESMNYTN